MAKLKNSPLILPLRRPQYFVASEVFISSLAWLAYDTSFSKQYGQLNGFVYRKSNEDLRSFKIHSFMPMESRVGEFDGQLKAQGLKTGLKGIRDSKWVLGEAVSMSVLGTKSPRSKSQPASPLSPAFALMQNLAGLLNKKGPAEVGLILESMFALGAPSGYSGPGASELLADAYKYRLKDDPLLRAMDKAAAAALLGQDIERLEHEPIQGDPWWSQQLDSTPFEWLFEKWILITSENWVASLPARVWVDWATTVLRLGLAMGYLWEASWYEAIAKRILSDTNEPFTPSYIRSQMSAPLTWNAHHLGTAMRDVSSPLKKRIDRAHSVKDCIEVWQSKNSDMDPSFENQLTAMHSDDELRDLLVEALNPPRDVGKNTWEAVQYALSTREAQGDYADYYGLLRRRGTRYLEPSPGIEWIAVMASLACPGPRGECDAGDLLRDLGRLGARPELRDLIECLERAGLARNSADADQGVLIESAF